MLKSHPECDNLCFTLSAIYSNRMSTGSRTQVIVRLRPLIYGSFKQWREISFATSGVAGLSPVDFNRWQQGEPRKQGLITAVIDLGLGQLAKLVSES